MNDEEPKSGESRDDAVRGLRDAFRRGYIELATENEKLRQQIERQAGTLASYAVRERNHRRLIEDQYHLLDAAHDNVGEGTLLRIPVRDAMDLPSPDTSAPAGPADTPSAPPSRKLRDWILRGAPTTGDPGQTPGVPGDDEAAQRARTIFETLRRPSGLVFRPSPGLAAYTLRRGELRTIAFNLIGVAEARVDPLAEEICQAVALNRRFAPLIVTTSRSELGALRRRRLSYESIPPFSAAIEALTGISDPHAYYDIRLRYLLRKWRAVSVVNLSDVHVFAEAQPGDSRGS